MVLTRPLDLGEGQLQGVPNVHEGVHEVPLHLLVVVRGGRDPQSLLASLHGGVVDVLDVDAVLLHEQVRGCRASLRVAHLVTRAMELMIESDVACPDPMLRDIISRNSRDYVTMTN